uniref:Ig-like domain-containing protein n=1 Tax=Esox lucius TaxID=8010 RepID=A0AAY5KR27_ESOLU
VGKHRLIETTIILDLTNIIAVFCLSTGITNTGLVVIQSPHYVTVTEGETVHIQCCWNKNLTRVTVNWKSNAANTSELVNKSQCQKSASEQNVSCCSNLTISNLNRNDSGTYTCKVSSEIPVLQQSVGNGTHLTVTSKNDGIIQATFFHCSVVLTGLRLCSPVRNKL